MYVLSNLGVRNQFIAHFCQSAFFLFERKVLDTCGEALASFGFNAKFEPQLMESVWKEYSLPILQPDRKLKQADADSEYFNKVIIIS